MAEGGWVLAEFAFFFKDAEDGVGVLGLFFPLGGGDDGAAEFGEGGGEFVGFGVGDAEGAGGEGDEADVMALLDEAVHGAAHADDGVLGFGAEDEAAFGVGFGALGAVGVVGVGFAAGPAGDGVLEAVEDADVELVAGALLGEEVGEAVLVVVFVDEFEDGAAGLQSLPDDGAAGFGGGPGGGADEPGELDSGEFAGGAGVDEEAGVGVVLKEGGGDGLRDGAFDGAGGDGGFVFSPGHEDEAAGAEDGADAHGDGEVGDVFLAPEVGGGVLAGDAVEGDAAGEGIAGGAGFVEADVAGAADAENLKVDAADGVDFVFVGFAVGEDLIRGDGARGDVDVFGGDVDVVEELLAHEAGVAFGVVGGEAVVFVEVEGDDVLEAEFFLAVEADEFAVEGDGGGAGGEAEDGGAAGAGVFLHEGLHFLGERLSGGGGGGEDQGGGFFVDFGGGAGGHLDCGLWILDCGLGRGSHEGTKARRT